MTEQTFGYRNGSLHCEGSSLIQIAKQVRPPFYVYAAETLRQRYRDLTRALSDIPHLVCYAMKANAQPELLRLLLSEGSGVEAVSGAELLLARRLGFPPQRIVLSGVGKTDEELAAGLRENVHLFTVESERELHTLERIAAEAGARARVGIRINPDIDARTHPKISTGVRTAKFGLDPEVALALYARHREFPHLTFAAIHAHIGSQITELEPLRESARVLAHLVDDVRARGIPIDEIDVGGGLGISYEGRPVPTIAEYARAMVEAFGNRDLTLLLEPGRVLVGPVGALVVEVLYTKEVHGHGFAVVNAGMNDLLRPALYHAYHRIEPVTRRHGPETTLDVVGAVCESSDVFGRERVLPDPRPGDLLAIMDAGAYGFVMSSNYNLRPRPAEVVVEGNAYRLVRRAESWNELVSRELGDGA